MTCHNCEHCVVCSSTNKEDIEDLHKGLVALRAKLAKVEGAYVALVLNENKEVERLEAERDHFKLLYANNHIDKLQRIYDSEVNGKISWFFDAGVTVSIGDKLNGIKEIATFYNVADAIDWLDVESRKYSSFHEN